MPVRAVACDIFSVNKHGEVKGRLYYDAAKGYLVALTHDRGAFALSLDGEVLERVPDVCTADYQYHTDFESSYGTEIAWDYSPVHHLFYTWDGGLIEKGFPASDEQDKR